MEDSDSTVIESTTGWGSKDRIVLVPKNTSAAGQGEGDPDEEKNSWRMAEQVPDNQDPSTDPRNYRGITG